MDLDAIRTALKSIPEIKRDPAEAEDDAWQAAAAFTKSLRKVGVQQMRDSRELLTRIQEALGPVETVREALERERSRAADGERQVCRLAEAVISTLDALERMVNALEAAGLERWSSQTLDVVELCLRDGTKAGLTTLGRVGEPFDPDLHDLAAAPLKESMASLRVELVVARGYALNGQVLRRALVTLEGAAGDVSK